MENKYLVSIVDRWYPKYRNQPTNSGVQDLNYVLLGELALYLANMLPTEDKWDRLTSFLIEILESGEDSDDLVVAGFLEVFADAEPDFDSFRERSVGKLRELIETYT